VAFCHPEPFDKLKINSAKDLEILRRPAYNGGNPQNDNRKQDFPDRHQLDDYPKSYIIKSGACKKKILDAGAGNDGRIILG